MVHLGFGSMGRRDGSGGEVGKGLGDSSVPFGNGVADGTNTRQLVNHGLNAGPPICYSAFQRGWVISARLLRSPVSSDCAFSLCRLLRVQSLHLPSKGAWLGVVCKIHL